MSLKNMLAITLHDLIYKQYNYIEIQLSFIAICKENTASSNEIVQHYYRKNIHMKHFEVYYP